MAGPPLGAALCDRLLFPAQGGSQRQLLCAMQSPPAAEAPATGSHEAAAAAGGTTGAALVLYARRWLMLLLFCLLSCVNGAMWIQFASVANICQTYFGTTALAVDWLSMIYMALYIPGIFPAVRLFELRGLRVGLLVGAGLNAAGAVLRWEGAASRSFATAFLGQTVCSVAQCFTLGVPPMLAAAWFGPQERARATSIGVLSNQLGGALGLLSSVVVKHGSDLPALLGGTALASAVIFGLLLIGFQAAPPTPPSRSQKAIKAAPSLANGAAAASAAGGGGGSEYAQLMRDGPFLLLLVAYGIVVGVYYTVGTLINAVLVQRFGDAAHIVTLCGWVGATLVLAGVPGVLLCGAFLDATGWFHGTCRVLFALSALSMGCFSAAVQWGSMEDVCITAAAVGFFVTALVAAGFEFAAELTYPITVRVRENPPIMPSCIQMHPLISQCLHQTQRLCHFSRLYVSTSMNLSSKRWSLE